MNNTMPKIIQLSNESDGECPCGCGEDAYMFTVEGVESGYVDAAPKCARTFLVDAGLLPDEDELIDYDVTL